MCSVVTPEENMTQVPVLADQQSKATTKIKTALNLFRHLKFGDTFNILSSSTTDDSDGLWWFQAPAVFGFPKNKCGFEAWPYLVSTATETVTAPINGSDTAHGPTRHTGLENSCSNSQGTQQVSGLQDGSSEDIYCLTWRALPVREFCSKQFTNSKRFLKKLGISDWKQDPNTLSCFLG